MTISQVGGSPSLQITYQNTSTAETQAVETPGDSVEISPEAIAAAQNFEDTPRPPIDPNDPPPSGGGNGG